MRIRPTVSILCCISASPFIHAQSTQSEIDELKGQVASLAKQLEAQQKQIDALQAASGVTDLESAAAQSVALVAAANRVPTILPLPPVMPEQANPATPANQIVKSDNGQVANPPIPFHPDQELPVESQETGPALKLGPADVQLLGYVALTGFGRSTNSGGNVGTSFGDIPYSNTAPGNISEFRLSSQSTRLAIRADADLASSKVAGYFEMDFSGQVPGDVAVTSSSYGFRIRQAWMDYQAGKFEITGGQMFTLLTSLKKDILPWPGEVSITQVVDTNYVAGLVWARVPAIRFVCRASKAATFGFSTPELCLCSRCVRDH